MIKALFSNGNQNLTSITTRKHVFDQIHRIFQQNNHSIKMAFETFSSQQNSIGNSTNFEFISNGIRELFKQNEQMIRDTLQTVISTDAHTNLTTAIHTALKSNVQTIIDELKKAISLSDDDSEAIDKIIDAIQTAIEQNERGIFDTIEKLSENNNHSAKIPCESVKKLSDVLIIAFKLIEVNVYHSLETVVMHCDIDKDWIDYELENIAKFLDKSSNRIENLAYGDFEQNLNDMLNKISKFHDKLQ